MTTSRVRRSKGDGLIRERSDGRWEGRIPLGVDDESGKTLYKHVYGKTQKDVRDKMKAFMNDPDEIIMPNGRYVKVVEESPEEDVTFYGEWLDTWLTKYKVNRLTPSTYESYRIIIENHVKPSLGDIPIADINTDLIQTLLNEKQEVGARKDRRKDITLAGSSVMKIKVVINASLKQAVKNRMIPYNPTEAAIPPKIAHKEISIMTPEEQDKFMGALKGHRLEALFSLALATGMRLGELLALTWDDVDFDKKQISISKSAGRIRNQETMKTEIIVGGPKSKSGYRNIAMLSAAVTILEKHHTLQQEELKLAGSAYNKLNLVFCSTVGGYIEPRRINTTLDKVLNKAGVDHINFHALRHTFATRALESGIPAKVIQEMLGHADVSLTLNRYTHLLKETMHTEMEKMNSVFVDGAVTTREKIEMNKHRKGSDSEYFQLSIFYLYI